MRILALSVATLAVTACAAQSDTPETQTPTDVDPPSPTQAAADYDFSNPDATFELPEALREVSGVTVMPDGRLAAVQDESGTLYIIDPGNGTVLEERQFGGPGDYEAVEHAAGALWVLEANGSLFQIPDGNGRAQEHELPLKKKCDAEGLAFDASAGRLLVACKEDPGEGASGDTHRAIYAFDVTDSAMQASPLILLERSRLDSDDNFKPSAVAVHPSTGEIYVMSSVRRAVAVIDGSGAIQRVIDLPAGRNAQPEGLAFAPDGTLYLTNEGPEGPATLQVFRSR